MRVDWANPTIIAAIVTTLGGICVAVITLRKSKDHQGSASQSSLLSRNTTQIQAGRDVRTNDSGKKSQSKRSAEPRCDQVSSSKPLRRKTGVLTLWLVAVCVAH